MNDVPKLFTGPTTDYTVLYAFLAVVGLILGVIIYVIIAKIKGWELPKPERDKKALKIEPSHFGVEADITHIGWSRPSHWDEE